MEFKMNWNCVSSFSPLVGCARASAKMQQYCANRHTRAPFKMHCISLVRKLIRSQNINAKPNIRLAGCWFSSFLLICAPRARARLFYWILAKKCDDGGRTRPNGKKHNDNNHCVQTNNSFRLLILLSARCHLCAVIFPRFLLSSCTRSDLLVIAINKNKYQIILCFVSGIFPIQPNGSADCFARSTNRTDDEYALNHERETKFNWHRHFQW